MMEEKIFRDETNVNAPSAIQEIAQCKDGNFQFEGQERCKQTGRGSTFHSSNNYRRIRYTKVCKHPVAYTMSTVIMSRHERHPLWCPECFSNA